MARGVAIAGATEGAPAPATPARAAAPRKALPFGLSWRRLVEAIYVMLLGFLLIRLIWTIVTPIEAPPVEGGADGTPRIDADLAVFDRFDPFGGGQGVETPREVSYAGAAETTLNLRLVGISAGGGVGTAIIELPDGNQKSFIVGEDIIGGVSLRDVLTNQAILNRNGLTETLTLKDRQGRAISVPGRGGRDLPQSRRAAPPARETAILTPGQALDTLSQAFDFRPVEGPDGEGSYAIAPGSAPAFFEEAGFAQGDVVVAVDGMPAPQDPERLLELMADLPPGRPFTVTVERDGVPLDVPVDLRSF